MAGRCAKVNGAKLDGERDSQDVSRAKFDAVAGPVFTVQHHALFYAHLYFRERAGRPRSEVDPVFPSGVDPDVRAGALSVVVVLCVESAVAEQDPL